MSAALATAWAPTAPRYIICFICARSSARSASFRPASTRASSLSESCCYIAHSTPFRAPRSDDYRPMGGAKAQNRENGQRRVQHAPRPSIRFTASPLRVRHVPRGWSRFSLRTYGSGCSECTCTDSAANQRNETLDLREALAALRAGWWMPVIGALLGGLAGSASVRPRHRCTPPPPNCSSPPPVRRRRLTWCRAVSSRANASRHTLS